MTGGRLAGTAVDWKGFRESSHERVKKSPTGRVSGRPVMKGLRRAPLEGFQGVQS